MTLFKPKDTRAQWEKVYDLLAPLDIGDVLTYEAITEALDVDHINKVRNAVTKAANEWGKEKHRAIKVVNRVGYRVVSATEHETLARSHHKRSRRQMAKGLQVIRNTDRSLLSPQDRERFDRVEMQMARQASEIRRIDLRQREMDRVFAEEQTARRVSEEKIARMQEALRRHGIDPG